MPYVSPVLEHDLQTQSVELETGYWPPVTAALCGLPGRMNEWVRAEQVGVTSWWEPAGTA